MFGTESVVRISLKLISCSEFNTDVGGVDGRDDISGRECVTLTRFNGWSPAPRRPLCMLLIL